MQKKIGINAVAHFNCSKLEVVVFVLRRPKTNLSFVVLHLDIVRKDRDQVGYFDTSLLLLITTFHTVLEAIRTLESLR